MALRPENSGPPDEYVPLPPAAVRGSQPSIFLETLRCEIKREYAEVATDPAKGFHFHTGRPLAKLLGAELIAALAEAGFEAIEIPWRAEVFRGAPQDKSSASLGTLGINLRARKRAAAREIAEGVPAEAAT